MQHILDVINNFGGMIPAAAPVAVVVVLEFVFRLIPTSKPLSILHLAGDIMTSLGNLLVKGGALLDKVLPQVVKE